MNKKSNHKFADKVNLSQFRRLFNIHQNLANREYLNTAAFSRKLGVHRRTIKRDIAFMRDSLSAPIKYDSSKKGYYYAHLNWEMPLSPLTEGELLAFFVAAIALQGKGTTYEEKTLHKAISKIAASLPEEISVNLSCLFENTSFQSPPHVLVEGKLLQTLHQATVEHELLEISYVSKTSGKSENRRIEPLHLHNHEGTWYVVAFDHKRKQILIFHTARISDLKNSGEYFNPHKDFRKEDYLGDSFGMFRGGKQVKVEILFDEYQSNWMKERNLYHSSEQRRELPDGTLELKFTVGEDGLEAVARFCLQYAGHCQIIKPLKLKEIVKEELKKGLELNK